jgi:hypothetical protein
MTEQEIKVEIQRMLDAGIPRQQIEEWVRTAKRELQARTQQTASAFQKITPVQKQVVEESDDDDGDSDTDVETSLELPKITYKDIDLPEGKAIEILKKKIGGLGFTFEETGAWGWVPGTDYVNITAPPEYEGQPMEERVTKRFSFDQWWGKRQNEADGINAFIKKHANNSQDINASEYAKAWNHVSKRAGQQDISKLSSQEIVDLSNDILLDLDKSKDVTQIIKRIEESMGGFTQKTADDLMKKYDVNTVEGRNAALEELNLLIQKEFSRRVTSDDEYVKLRNSNLKAVQSYFGQDIEKQVRKEGELEVMPGWVNKNPVLNSLVKGVWGTANVKLPKAKYEFTGLNSAKKLEDISSQIEEYANMDPDAVVYYDKGFSITAAPKDKGDTENRFLTKSLSIPPKRYKVSELIPLLERNKRFHEQEVAYNIVKSDKYQQKLSKITLPKIFDEEGVGVSGDEFGRIIGDQGVQMITAAFTLGGSTLMQEGGGAYSEITTAKAAMKMFPGMDKEKAIASFQKLPMEKKTAAILDLIEKGEADLDAAFAIGTINAGLDLASNFVVIGKAKKFLPKSLGRDFLAGRYEDFLKGGWKTMGKDVGIGSFSEYVTETMQESVNIFGVGTATGETLSDMATKENVTRLMEAGGQAIIATGPIITSGQVASTVTNEIVSKVASIKNPEHQRNYINQSKKQIDQEFKQGKWTKKERDDIFTSLEAAEQSFNFKNLDGQGRENVVNKLADVSKNKTKINGLEQKIKKQKQESADIIGEETSNIIDEIELKKLKKQNAQSNKDIIAEVFTSNYRNSGKSLANWVNGQKEGLFKDKEIITFKTVKEAEKYINSNNLKFNTEQQKQDFLDGKINGANLGDLAILVDENINKNTKKGDWTSSNAIHHETLHFILDSFDTKELETIMNSTINKMKSSKDPKMIDLYDLTMERFNQYKEDPDVDKATEVQEFFTSLSDAAQALKLRDLNVENGSVLNDIGEAFQKLFTRNTTGSIDYSGLNAENTLEFIKKYNDFNGRGPKYQPIQIKGGTDVREKPVKESKVASDNVQRIYEEQGEAGAMDIIDAFKPITSRLVEKRSQAPNFDRQLLTDEIETGQRGIFDLIREYKPESGVPLAAFINTYLPARAIEASQRVLGEEFTEDVSEKVDIAAEEVVEPTVTAKPKPKKIVLADRLDITDKTVKAVKKILPDLDISGLTIKTLKNKIPNITGELFGISPKKIKSGANITKSELQSAQMFINKNADLLIAMLPEGATPSGTATGVPKVLLNEFYTKTDRAKMAKTGTKAGLAIQQKNKINKADFLEVFGIIEGKPVRTDRNTSARVLALANQLGKMITNQTVRQELAKKPDTKKDITRIAEGKSDVLFSKSVVDIVGIRSLFQLETKGIDKLLRLYGIDSTFNLKTEEGINNFIEEVKTKLLPLMPKEFWFGKGGGTVFTPSYYVVGSSDNKVLKQNYKDLYNNILVPKIKALAKDPDVKFGKPIKDITDFSVSSYSTIFKDGKTIRDNAKAIKAWNKKVATIHEEMWKRFNNAIAKDKNNAKVIGNYMKMVGSDTKHWHKLGAQFVGYSKKITGKRFEYEHAMPATSAYLYLMDAALSESNFDASYDAVINNYKLIALDKAMDKKLTKVGLQRKMPEGWDLMQNNWWDRYFNDLVNDIDGGIDPNSIVGLDGKTFGEIFNIKKPIIKQNIRESKALNKAIVNSRSVFKKNFQKFQAQKQRGKQFVKDLKTKESFDKFQAQKQKGKEFVESILKQSKGITVLDFDDTLATTKSLVKYTTPDGTTGTLNAEQYASTYEDLQDQGYTFDFSDFNKVVKGKLAPLFNKAIKLQDKFGPENMFVLTARPPQAAKAIFDFLKANGLNIPIKNITGLANSTSEAKALWIADKVGEGYNDFYFADDALQNVQAVKNMLDQFDVKSKVQQAKVKFSKGMNTEFNNILENVTGIESKKRFSAIKARKRGADKGKFRFFIPPSHEDFVGLLYNFMGKGKEGNAHRDFFEKALIRPLNRAYRELNTAKQSIANDYKSLNKQFGDVKKKLTKKTPDGDFTYQDAIRVYLWDKHGDKIPGLSPTDQQNLVDLVMGDSELQAYAETLNVISKRDNYVSPTESWEAGDIRTDLDDATGRIGREDFFTEFFENADIIFSQENLNKIEAAYGADMVSALKDILYRTKTGRNRPSGQNKMVNQFLNYLNGSVASTMFFNIRSAVLQQMSMVNFINYADNNVFSAAKAFANQPQYWKDWATIFNSDFMKQRRGGIKTDVNGAELAATVKDAKNPINAAIKKLLELGFLPTQIGDNIAIATGGSTFYRNRINTYLKQGLSQKEAESKAWTDFQVLAEATQQSARPDMVSQQQASPLGKVILAFQNVTSQFNRLGKKAFLDIKNRRITPGNPTQLQSDMSNLSRIAYYFAIQNLIFYSLQSALFMAMFDDDEEDERWLKKKERMVNGSIDSVLRGTGVWGAAVATLKNMAIKWHEQRDKGWNKDESAVLMEMLNVSPPLGIKARKMVNAEKTLNYNKKVIDEMSTFDIDNPMWSAVTSYTEATTNIPLNRLYNKTQNVRESLDNQHSAFERALMFSGWSKWNLGIGDSEKIEKVKETIKEKKKKQKFTERKEVKIEITPTEKLFNLSKKQQVDSLLNLGLTKKEIREELKYEKDRVERILKIGGKPIKRKKKIRTLGE